jgi:hypothetical protein
MSKQLILLDKVKVHVVDIDASDAESGIAWDYRMFDIGTEFPDNEEGVTWLFDQHWVEDKDFRWLNK